MADYESQYDAYRQAVEERLKSLFSETAPYGRLQQAMSYSLLAGGKRVRPVLVLAFCEALGGDWQKALPFACGIELVHTYSLIHDDLPCMDDDDLRRGRPTCHKVYGETVAVLAGDALQAEAFRLLSTAPCMTDHQRSIAVAALSRACGADGMVAGQVLDMEGYCDNVEQAKLLHRLKTGAMLRCACELGCAAAGADEKATDAARSYGDHLGLAFQVRDDVLDVIADQKELGKPIGSDQAEGKRTFVDLLGLGACQELVERETALAREALTDFPDADFLRELARRLADRRS